MRLVEMQVIETLSDRESGGRERAARTGVALGAVAFDFYAAYSEGCESSGTGNSRPSGVIGPRRNDSGESLLTRKQFSSGTRSRVGGLRARPQRAGSPKGKALSEGGGNAVSFVPVPDGKWGDAGRRHAAGQCRGSVSGRVGRAVGW